MNIFLQYWHPGLYLGSAVVGAIAISNPAQAAAFSNVFGELQINFAQPSLPTGTSTITDTFTLTIGGPAIAVSEAIATFQSIPGENAALETTILNEVGGNQPFFGLADSTAAAAGLFFVDTDEVFAFDFSLTLGLSTSIDDSQKDTAFSLGNVGLALFSNSPGSTEFNFFDGLQLIAEINTPGKEEEPLLLVSNNFEITNQTVKRQLGDLDEFLLFDISGSFEKAFSQPTLVQVQGGQLEGLAIAQSVPAPSILWGILGMGGIGIFQIRSRNPKKRCI